MDSFAYTTVFSALTNPVYASGFTTSALFLLIVTPFLLVFLATMTTILALTSLFSAGISMLTSNFFRELLQAIVVAGGFDVDHPVVQGIIKCVIMLFPILLGQRVGMVVWYRLFRLAL